MFLCERLAFFCFFWGICKALGLLWPTTEGMEEYLRLANPILPFLKNRVIIAAAALAEISVGTYALNNKPNLAGRSGALLWIASMTGAYKIALFYVNYHGPCGCLLGLNKFLPMTPSHQRLMADALLVAIFLIMLPVFVFSRFSNRLDFTARESMEKKNALFKLSNLRFVFLYLVFHLLICRLPIIETRVNRTGPSHVQRYEFFQASHITRIFDAVIGRY